MATTILEGSNFCISDQNGDFTFTTSGLYAFDTRFLSRLELRINGERPLLLSSGKVEYYSAAFYLRNPLAGELPQDAISIARHRFVGEGMQDRVRVQNESMEKVGFELALEIGNDFADIFAVKSHDFALGDPAAGASAAAARRGALRGGGEPVRVRGRELPCTDAGDPLRARTRRVGQGSLLDRARAARRLGAGRGRRPVARHATSSGRRSPTAVSARSASGSRRR